MEQQKSPIAALKEKAAEYSQKSKEIQSKIKDLEDQQYLKIGKIVVEHHKKSWSNFDVTGLKKSVTEILES
jgi:hypothetical protein